VHFYTYRARYFIILAGCLEAAKLNRQPNGSYPNFNLTKRGVCHHCCVRFKSQVCCRGLGACCCGSVECLGDSGTGCMAAGACAPIKATPPLPTVHLRSTPPTCDQALPDCLMQIEADRLLLGSVVAQADNPSIQLAMAEKGNWPGLCPTALGILLCENGFHCCCV
jgi:hypothetical protein